MTVFKESLEMRQYPLGCADWIVRVANSCTTLEQLEITEKLHKLYVAHRFKMNPKNTEDFEKLCHSFRITRAIKKKAKIIYDKLTL